MLPLISNNISSPLHPPPPEDNERSCNHFLSYLHGLAREGTTKVVDVYSCSSTEFVSDKLISGGFNL